MTGMHARPGQRRDAARARLHDTWTRLAGWLRAPRAALMPRGRTAAAAPGEVPAPAVPLPGRSLTQPNPKVPAAPVQPEAAPSPQARLAPSPFPGGEGATAVLREWDYPATPGQHPFDGSVPMCVIPAAAFSTALLYGELVEVTDSTGPRAVIWPQAEPSLRETGQLAALGEPPPWSGEWAHDPATLRAAVKGLRAL